MHIECPIESSQIRCIYWEGVYLASLCKPSERPNRRLTGRPSTQQERGEYPMANRQVSHFACRTCEQPFLGRSIARFCSDKCRSRFHRDRQRAIIQAAKAANLEEAWR